MKGWRNADCGRLVSSSRIGAGSASLTNSPNISRKQSLAEARGEVNAGNYLLPG
jgi:hypothetical protein